MLQQLHREGHTVVLITHDNSIAVQAERIIRLEDGQVVYDGDATRLRPSCSPLCPAKRHRRKQNNGIRDFPPGTAERLEQ